MEDIPILHSRLLCFKKSPCLEFLKTISPFFVGETSSRINIWNLLVDVLFGRRFPDPVSRVEASSSSSSSMMGFLRVLIMLLQFLGS